MVMSQYLSLYDAQTEILQWLESKGHAVDYGSGKPLDDWRVWQMCKRKRRFQMRPEEDERRRVYACPHCEGWHFTRRR
jgi:hypothetical protein